ncbi:uncharacterized protein LOC105649919 isoform X2 [Jatropha curcas]|uniref:uncharacterized protein LOC105649919 isoform X2 n=1 Tax=Jatropha curcas TaxID=180498 RepID=UPI0005FBF3CE|nr:uncharacterized protein LOC105649919 isoform X2 [Jatropha curcas]XP_020541290.1 uncharacterized protein LOC105649919 isoform X2 [Jatropha curcas]XP_037492157.1 uncharacterized protein LOC105649919 isoform X2 [Jatropha curcas]
MKFQEGDSVEVLRREQELYCEGEPVIEKVHKEDLRPWPTIKRRKRWVVGDVAEAFDIKSWRVGKIVKVLKNNMFVVRLFGSIQLKEFHDSNLRIWQAWLKNNRSVTGKVDKESTKNFKRNKSKPSKRSVCISPSDIVGKGSCLRNRNRQRYSKDGQNNVKKSLPARKILNRSNADCLERSSKDLRSCTRGFHSPFFTWVNEISPQEVRADNKFDEEDRDINADIAKATNDELYNSSRPFTTKDIDQCSVASCSSNDFALSSSHNCNKALENVSDTSDAESSFPSSSVNERLTPYFEQKFEADIHELEFHAYRSTVQALYASGPLSWEQESLLTNLRLSLNISDEEHLLQLRHLLSTRVVQ